MNDTIKRMSTTMAVFTPAFQTKAAAPADQTPSTNSEFCTVPRCQLSRITPIAESA